MSSQLNRLLLVLAFVASASSALAQRFTPPPALTGNSLTLSTSTNRVVRTPLRDNAAPPVLGAMVTLRNNGRQPAQFTFPDPELAKTKFTFSLFNAENTLVWTGAGTSTKRTANPPSASLSLPPRSSWQSAVRIPLTTDGTWLPTGFYRLEATLNGTPVTFAAASFEIIALPTPPEPSASGIMGLVLAPSDGFNSTQTPAVGASVTVESASLIPASSTANRTFLYQGVTSDEGRFDAKLPPGNYLVRVSWSPPQSNETQSSNQASMNPVPPIVTTRTVAVAKGRMAPLTIRLSGPRVPVRPIDPAQSLVLSVDEVDAMVILAEDGSKKIRVQAQGTVPNPGYTNARLVVPLIVPAIAQVEGNILFLQFAVDSPPPNLFFPQVLATVNAEVTLPYNDETVVWVFGQSNTLTKPVGPNSR